MTLVSKRGAGSRLRAKQLGCSMSEGSWRVSSFWVKWVNESHPVMSSSLRTHGLQDARLPCPSPPPWVCASSCPLHPWCHATISSCDALFSFYPQSFSASGSFPMSWLFKLGDKNIGASASASVLPVIIQGWFSFRLTGLISLLGNIFLLWTFSRSALSRACKVILCQPHFADGQLRPREVNKLSKATKPH